MSDAADAELPGAGPEDTAVFSMGERTFTVADILRAAHFRGEITPHWQDLLLKLACLEHASGQSLQPESAALQARADQFRYERDLITSEETEQWLAKRGLDEEHFSSFVLRSYWKDTMGERITPTAAELATADEDLRAQLTIELLLSGAFGRMARALAWRVASHPAPAIEGAPVDLAEERREFFLRTAVEVGSLNDWLNFVGGDEAWFEEMLALESAYRQRTATIVTPDRLTRALRSQRLSLMQFVVEEIEFDSMEAAREAVLCVRQDHMSMQEVARDSGLPLYERTFLLEEMPAEWQMPLLSTPTGSLAGPFSDEELIRLFRVQSKVEAEITDEAVRTRLEEHLVRSYFEELCTERHYKVLL